MMFAWILLVAFLLVIFQVRNEKGNDGRNKGVEQRTRAILQERFASGEINRQEYLHMLTTLEYGG